MNKVSKMISYLVGSLLAFSSLNVFASSIDVVFSPNTIGSGSTSKLTVSINNTSGASDRDIAFSASLPAGVEIAAPFLAETNCGVSSSITATGGGSSFSLNNGELANNDACSISLLVTSSTVGAHVFTTPLVDIGDDNGVTGTGTLTVDGNLPAISFSLASNSIVVGENVRATLTIDNSNGGSNFSSLSAQFSLPTGLAISDFPDTSNDCGFTGDLTSLFSGVVLAGASCTFSQNLKASQAVNSVVQSSLITGANPFPINLGYVADDIVVSRPTLIMNMLSPVSPGQSGQLEFTLTNLERSQAASDIDFTLDLSGLAVAGVTWSATGLTNVCGNGDLSGSGSSLIEFDNGSLAEEESCIFNVDIHAPVGATPGSYKLTSSTVVVDSVNKGTATADFIIVGAPLVDFRFVQSGNEVTSVKAGETVGIEFTYTDTNSSNVTAIASKMVLNNDVSVTVSNLPSTPCGSGSSIAQATDFSGELSINLSNGNFLADSSCTFTVDIDIPSSVSAGTLNYTFDTISSTVNSETVLSNKPSKTLDIVGAPKLRITMPQGVQANDSGNLVVKIDHNASSPTSATNIGFTLDLNAVLTGLEATGLPSSDVCGSGSAVSGTSTITLVNGELAAGASCSFSIPVAIPNSANAGSYTATTSAITAMVDSLSVTGAAASSNLIVTGLTGSLEFLTSVMPGGTVKARYTLNNVGPDDLTTLGFTHSLSSTLSGLAYSGGSLSDICGGGSALTGTTNLSFAGGIINSGDSCTFEIDLDVPVSAIENNYGSVTSGLSYVINGSTALAVDALSAILVVEQPIIASASFSDVSINDQSTATLVYTIENTGADEVTGITFTDDFDTVLSGASANISDSTQCNGNLSGSSVLSFSGGSIASGATCTITVGVDLPDINSQLVFQTTSSAITGMSNGLAVNVDAVSADITVLNSALEVLVSVGSPSTLLASTGPLTFPVTISNADDISLTAADVNISSTGTANASVSITGGTTSTPTINLTSLSGDGTLAVSVNGGIARNDSSSSIATSISQSATIDNTKPQILLTSTQNGNTLNSLTPFVVNVVFAEDNDGLSVSKSDLVLVNATASDFSISDGNSTTTTITPLADGVVTVTLAADTIVDTANNGNVQQSVGFTYDNTKPTLAISAPSENVNSAFTASFTFSENVTGFDATDIVVSNASLSSFSGSDANYSVLVTPTTDGDVTLDVTADVAIDSAINGNSAATQLSVNYDTTQPTVTILPPAGKQNSDFTIQVQFSEMVNNFELSDIVTNNAILSNLSDIGGGNYTVSVSPNGDGQLTFDVAAGVTNDLAGNPNLAASQKVVDFDASAPEVTISATSLNQNSPFTANIDFTENVSGFDINDIQATNAGLSDFAGTNANYTVLVTPTNDGQVLLDIAAAIAVDGAGNNNTAAVQFVAVYDTQLPTVSINAPATPQNSAFTVNINFNEDVTGFDVTDIGVTNAVLSNFSGANASYSVLVTPDGNADITLSIEAGVAQDAANNNNTAAQPSSVQFDDSAPSTTISMPSGTQNSAFNATIEFDESVTGFTQSDITATNATLSNFSGSGASYAVTVTPSSDGTVSLNVAAGVAQDAAGNANTAAQSASVEFDGSGPTTTITMPSVTQNSAFNATVEFGESVTGFTQSDITATNATLSNFSGSGASYTVTVTPSSDGTVSLNVAAGVAQDAAGNNNTAAQTASVQYDGTVPIATITAPESIQNSAFTVTVTFSETVVGFTQSDLNVSNAALSDFSGSGAIYTLTVTPRNDGQVSLSVAEGVVKDAAGNDNRASQTVNVQFDGSAPEVTLSTANLVVSEEFEVISTFSETTSTLSSSAFTVGNGVVQTLEKISETSYKVIIQPTQSGTVSLTLKANSVSDEAGNGNLVSNTLEVEYSSDLVTVVLDAPEKANSTFLLGINFGSAVTGFDISDLQTSNATLSNFKVLSNSSFSVEVLGSSVGKITITVPENVVLDEFGNGNLASAPITVQFDNVEPNIQSRIPLNNSDTVSINTEFSITFDENIVLGGGQITLVDMSDSSEVLATQLTVLGNTLTFAFSNGLKANASYQILVEAGVVTDEFGNLSAQGNVWKFTTDNSAPVANDDTASTEEDKAVIINVAANDSDADTELDLSSILLSDFNKGAAVVTSNGEVEFIPDENFNGEAGFTYSIADTSGARSNEALVLVTVSSVNDAPEFTSEPTVSTGVLVEYEYQLEVSDVDSENLTVTLLSAPEWLSLNEQLLTGVAPANASGKTFNITLEVSDGELSAQQSFALKVVEFDESLITIQQSVNVSSILVDEAFEHRVVISNTSNQGITLAEFAIDIQGVDVITSDSSCTLEQSYVCQLASSLASSDSIELVFTLQAAETGEFTSLANLVFNDDMIKQDSFAKVVVETVSDEMGDTISLTDVNSVAFADFNNDGLTDIVFAANLNSAVFINQGAGEYEFGASILSTENVKHVAVADFDLDGLTDIAFATESSFGSGILFNSGNLVFSEVQIVSTIPSQWVFAFDINADTLQDVVLLDDSQQGISIFTQPFSSALQEQLIVKHDDKQFVKQHANDITFNDLATSDLNGDGVIDLVLAVDGKALELWYQGTNGEFEIVETALKDVHKLKVADLDHDGVSDVVAITDQGLEVLHIDSNQVTLLSSVSYQSIELANVLADDTVQIVALSETGEVSFFTAIENGYQLQPVILETASGSDIALADVDQDGDLDMLISSSSGDNEVRYNQGNGIFGEQTTDLALSVSASELNVTKGDSGEWLIFIDNNGLAAAENPELFITVNNAEITEISSEVFSCSADASDYVCAYQGVIEVGEQLSVTASLLFSTVGNAQVNALISNERTDDNSTNNEAELVVNTRSPAVITEPVKKKSSGNLLYLLLVMAIFMIIRHCHQYRHSSKRVE